jgi:energy-coupling factor transport system substrate-specific component
MKTKKQLTAGELAEFALLGGIMFCSKVIMEWAPNIHFLAMLTVTYTIVCRGKALFPIYTYVMLNGLYAGFNPWWFPYLYLWTILWGAAMLLPRNLPKRASVPIYMAVCGLHGLLFGTLYAPAQAIMFHLSFQQTIAWIIAGLPFDFIHAAGDFCAGALVLPCAALIRKVKAKCV